MRNTQERNHDFTLWSNLESIMEVAGLSDDFVASELGLTKQKFLFHRYNKLEVPFTRVVNLSRKLGLSLPVLLQESIARESICESLKLVGRSRTPTRYKNGDGSKTFTLRHILDTAKKYGIYAEVCDHFSLDRMIYETKVDFQISVQLASDLLQFISQKVALRESDFDEMGLKNAMYFKDSSFGAKLTEQKDVISMFEALLDVTNHIEDNWYYELQAADKNKILLNSYPSARLTDLYKRIDYSSLTFSKFRMSMITNLLRYQGFKNATGTLRRSVHHGDSYCVFEIDLSDLVPLSPMVV